MTLASSTRYKRYDPTISTDTFIVSFPLFSNDDLDVYVDGVKTEAYSVVSSYQDSESNDAAIVLTAAVVNVPVEIYGNRAPRRENNYLGGSPDLARNLQLDADIVTATQQEVVRDAVRAVRLPVDSVISPELPDLQAGETVIVNAEKTGFERGPDASSISAAESNAAAAAASAAAAAAAENSLLEWQGEWATATAYGPSDIVHEAGSAYICEIAHTSATFSTDLSALRWRIFAQQGSAGAGTGDMLNSENLSGLIDKAAAFAAIKQLATFTETGVVELATNDEMTAGAMDKVPDALKVKNYVNDAVVRLRAVFSDTKAQNTAFQAHTANTWTTHQLGTVDYDPDSLISLSANRFTTANAGSVKATTRFRDVAAIRLYSVTDGAVVSGGIAQTSFSPAGVAVPVTGAWSVEAEKQYELQFFHNSTGNNPSNLAGLSEVYAYVEYFA